MSKNNEMYSVIDLFAGCGGLSEGFRQTGFDIIAQVEKDKWACETLKTRFLYYILKEIGKGYLYNRFLREKISREDILIKYPEIKQLIDYTVIQAEFGNDRFDEIIEQIENARGVYDASRIHVVIGGPPCQPYSVVGRARDPNRMELDSRHFLYEYYLRILQYFQPDFFVFENVPGLITARVKGEKIFLKIQDDLRNIFPSYEIAPGLDEYSKKPKEYLLDSTFYGIPQKRKRVIFIGYKRSLLSESPSIKNVFRKILKQKVYNYGGHTVEDAISDLPALRPREGNDVWYGEYSDKALTPYQRIMRRNSPGVLNHRARMHMSSDLERYRFFIEHHLNGNTATLIDLRKERPDLTPAHNHLDNFLDRFKVQSWSQPSSTITAHICRDGHYYIHPDIDQCRSFTVREAARCQSFPDNFKFEGPRTEQYRQVGNAVPPGLARAIARYIFLELRGLYNGKNR